MLRRQQPARIVDAGLLVIEAADQQFLIDGGIEAHPGAELMGGRIARHDRGGRPPAISRLVVVEQVARRAQAEAESGIAAVDADVPHAAGPVASPAESSPAREAPVLASRNRF